MGIVHLIVVPIIDLTLDMKVVKSIFLPLTAFFLMSFARPEKEFPIFQFPRDQIPRIDGDFSDWSIVPTTYNIGIEELKNRRFGEGENIDPSDFDLNVKVGWVKNLNRLYFYIDAYDDYWDNIFTPVKDKDWAMIWGNTPFDYASFEGPENSIVSKLRENELIALSWSMLDFDSAQCESFMNLSHDFEMISNASKLCAFRLMPLEEQYQKKIEAQWHFVTEDRKFGKLLPCKWIFININESSKQKKYE
jgi:hypothetical protein